MEAVKQSLVDAKVVAETLGFSTNFVYEQAALGAIPHYRLGKAIRFDLDEVRQAMRRGEPS